MEKPSIREVHGMSLANSQELVSEEGALAKLAALEYGWAVAYRTARRFYKQGFLPTLGEAVAMAETFLAYGTDDNPSQRTRRFGAFQRDATDMFKQFVLDRAGRYGGESNVTIEIRGPTGSGKSSAALSVAEMLGLRPGHVPAAVTFYPRPWMRAIIDAWERMHEQEDSYRVVMLDEETAAVGEGSRTKDSIIRTQEARLRQTGISMVFCAANKHGPKTRDVTLEMVGVNIETRQCLGLYFQGEEPIGYVVLDFCHTRTWEAYTPMKHRALELAVKLGGVDGAVLRTHIIETVLDDDMMGRMASSHFNHNAVRLEIDDDLAGAFSSNEINRIADRVAEIGRYWGEDGDPEVFRDLVLGLIEKGLAWEPRNGEMLKALLGVK